MSRFSTALFAVSPRRLGVFVGLPQRPVVDQQDLTAFVQPQLTHVHPRHAVELAREGAHAVVGAPLKSLEEL